MKLAQAMRHIRTGDAITFSGWWIFSKLIRWWTHDDVSHAGMAIWLRIGKESRDRLCILEAMEPGGIRLLPASIIVPPYWHHGGKVYWHQLKSDSGISGEEAAGFALEDWGTKYANPLQFLAIVSPTYRRLREHLGLTVKVGSEQFHCSELVTTAYQRAGFANGKLPCLTTPGDVGRFSCFNPRMEIQPDG